MKQQFFPQRLFMDMKRLIINRLVGLGLKAVGALHDANTPTANRPKPTNLFIINPLHVHE